MGTTTHGYPYPEGTDRVADGDDAIQALAEAIDLHLAGRLAFGVFVGTTDASSQVTINHGLPGTPTVVLAAVINSAHICTPGNLAATNFKVTVRIVTTAGAPGVVAGTAVTCYWIALIP